MFRQIDIETTEICNRRCGYCPNSTHYNTRRGGPGVMPRVVFNSIITQLSYLQFKGRVNLNMYGEPLIDSNRIILRDIRSVVEIGAVPAIYTNGDYIDDDYAVDLKAAGMGRLIVVATDHGSEPNRELRAICIRHGFDYRRFSATDVLHNRCGLVNHPMALGKAAVCFPAEQSHMYINARGQAQLCCNDYLAEIEYGDVVDRGIMQIWTDPLYISHRKRLPNPDLEICRKCNCTDWS